MVGKGRMQTRYSLTSSKTMPCTKQISCLPLSKMWKESHWILFSVSGVCPCTLQGISNHPIISNLNYTILRFDIIITLIQQKLYYSLQQQCCMIRSLAQIILFTVVIILLQHCMICLGRCTACRQSLNFILVSRTKSWMAQLLLIYHHEKRRLQPCSTRLTIHHRFSFDFSSEFKVSKHPPKPK